jgi:hypothetical protein
VPLIGLILLRLREFRKERAAGITADAADPVTASAAQPDHQTSYNGNGNGQATDTRPSRGSHRRGSAPR